MTPMVFSDESVADIPRVNVKTAQDLWAPCARRHSLVDGTLNRRPAKSSRWAAGLTISAGWKADLALTGTDRRAMREAISTTRSVSPSRGL